MTLAGALAACGGPQRPERIAVDVSAVAGRTAGGSAWDSDSITWAGTTERTMARGGGGLALRYDNGDGFGVRVRADAAYGHAGPEYLHLPRGTQKLQAGTQFPLFTGSLGIRARGESYVSDLGIVRLQSDRGDARHIPYLSGAPTDTAGVGYAYSLGTDDPMLVINILGMGVGAHLGRLEVRALLSVHGQLVGDPDASDVPFGLGRVNWGGWLDLRYDAEPFGIVLSALASGDPAARLGLTWSWELDPAPNPWGDVGGEVDDR